MSDCAIMRVAHGEAVMFFTYALLFIIGVIPCVLFGYAIVHRFEKLGGPQILRYVRSHKLKVAFWFPVSFGWPVVIYYLSFGDHSSFHAKDAILAFILGVIAMFAGAVWRNSERKEEEEKYLTGEGTGY